MNEDDYKLAIWKLNRSAVPKDEVLDWLHEAVVEWYDQGQPEIEHGLGNWLGLVAWRKWKSNTKSAAVRKTVLWSKTDLIPEETKEEGPDHQEILDEVLSGLTKTQQKYVHLWGRGLNCIETGLSINRSKQAISQCRRRIKEMFKDGLPAPPANDDVHPKPD